MISQFLGQERMERTLKIPPDCGRLRARTYAIARVMSEDIDRHVLRKYEIQHETAFNMEPTEDETGLKSCQTLCTISSTSPGIQLNMIADGFR